MLKATKTPKNNDDNILTIKEQLIFNPIFFLKLCFINNLKKSPSVPPTKIYSVDTKFKSTF